MNAATEDAKPVGWPYGKDGAAVSAAMQPVDSLAKALCKAQLEMKNPGFDANNPHFKSKFVSLAAVRNAVIPILAKHGISVTQDLTVINGGVGCRTILMHESGQQMCFGPLVLPPTKSDAQGFGSAATYARRYSLMAAAGIVGDEDDDGNAAAESNQKAYQDQRNMASEYAKRLTDAIETGIDGAVVDIAGELKGHEELYRAVWGQLPSQMRRQIKDILDRAKEPA